MPCLICKAGDQPCCASCWPHSQINVSSLAGLPKVSGADYRDLSAFILPFKDNSLMSMTRILAPIVSEALVAARAQVIATGAIAPTERINLVYPPSSRSNARRRGFNPTERLLRLGAPARHYFIHDGLRLLRQASDQGALDREGRLINLTGAMEAKIRNLERVLIFDDIVASGATLTEMRRAMEAAGNRVIGYCVLAESFLNSTTSTSQ